LKENVPKGPRPPPGLQCCEITLSRLPPTSGPVPEHVFTQANIGAVPASTPPGSTSMNFHDQPIGPSAKQINEGNRTWMPRQRKPKLPHDHPMQPEKVFAGRPVSVTAPARFWYVAGPRQIGGSPVGVVPMKGTHVSPWLSPTVYPS